MGGPPSARFRNFQSRRYVDLAIDPCVAGRHAADRRPVDQIAIDQPSADRPSIAFLAIDLLPGEGAAIQYCAAERAGCVGYAGGRCEWCVRLLRFLDGPPSNGSSRVVHARQATKSESELWV